MADSTPLLLPALGPFYQALGPLAETLLRVAVGAMLVPHGLRMCLGFFPGTGGPVNSFATLAGGLDRVGYRPGRLWAPVIAVTELVGGPLFALGLFTRLAAVPIVILLLLGAYDHGRRDGYFWNQQGLEYPLLWAIAALYFLVQGGGAWSLDRALLGWQI
jgi:putative oxidoreductase